MEQESNTQHQSTPVFNVQPVKIGDTPVRFLTPEGNYLDLPRKWYANSRYVARTATLINDPSLQNNDRDDIPGITGPTYLVKLSADDSRLNTRKIM